MREIARLSQVVTAFDAHQVQEALEQLRGFQTKICFELSGVVLTVAQRVLFHFIRSDCVSEDRVRRAIIRTRMELTIAGFIERVKENGRRAAENAFIALFKPLGIWEVYWQFAPKKRNPLVKNPAQSQAVLGIERVYAMLKKDWSL